MYHTGIGGIPKEALNDKSGRVMIENGPEGKYSKRFVRRKRVIFFEGQAVRVAKKENLKGVDKYEKGRFLGLGKVIVCCGGDSYIVRMGNGKLLKKGIMI